MTTYSWGTDRRINAASNHLRKLFGTRIQKLTIDAGFTCPNRDGTKGTGGCAFCNNDAFNPSYCCPEKTIIQQINEGIEFHETRYKSASRYLAYFQAYSNTYGSLEQLKLLYDQALQHTKVVGLIIGTRPDCVDEDILAYLAELARKYYVVIEYGIESVYDTTLQLVNRGHTYHDSKRALELSKSYGLRCGAHLMFGLPGETREQMLRAVQLISELPLYSVKLHQLQIVRGTRFARDYQKDPSIFSLFSLEEYVEFIVEYISRLNPEFILERVAAETQPRNCISGRWGLRYDQVLNKIEQRMKELDYWQGKFYRDMS